MPLAPDHTKEPIGTVGEMIDILSKFPTHSPLETAYGESMTRGAFEGVFQHEGNDYVFPGTVIIVSDWDNLRDTIVEKHLVFRG